MTWEEACRLLGVAENATQAEIKEQYFYKVQLLHPDKNLNKPEKVVQRAGEELAQVNEAYKFLSNPKNDPNNPPKLEVFPKHIRFADVALGQKKATTVEIKNTGGPFTNIWIENSPAPWLSVTDVKAGGAEPLPLTLTLEAQGLPEIIKEEQCSLPVRLKNEKTQLTDEEVVCAEITPLPSQAKLKVKPGKFSFRNVPIGGTHSAILEIKNSSSETLHGFLVAQPAWLSVSQQSINLPRRSLSRGYTVVVDAQNMPPRFRDTGHIDIYTNGGNASLPVEFSVSAQPSRYAPSSTPVYAPGTAQSGYPSAGAGFQAWNSPPKKRGGGFSFFRFLFLFIITFLAGTAVIYFFTAGRPSGIDFEAVRGWALVTLLVSLLIALLRK